MGFIPMANKLVAQPNVVKTNFPCCYSGVFMLNFVLLLLVFVCKIT